MDLFYSNDSFYVCWFTGMGKFLWTFYKKNVFRSDRGFSIDKLC